MKKNKLSTEQVERLTALSYAQGYKSAVYGLTKSDMDPIFLAEKISAGEVTWPQSSLDFSNDGVQLHLKLNGEVIHTTALVNPAEKSTEKPPYSLTEIMEHLNTNVIGQSEAKKVFARAAHMHYLRCFASGNFSNIPLKKQNVIAHGPSGCGKTETWRVLGEFLGVNVYIQDSGALSPSSYKGTTVADLAKNIWLENDKNMEKAETSILVLDEFDKLGSISNGESVASFRASVLNDLLKFIEGSKVAFQETPISPKMEFLDTKNILVVVLGAFEGMEKVFEEKAGIGFGAKAGYKPTYNEVSEKITVSDYEKFGFNAQILGRLPIRTSLKELTEEELVAVQKDVPTSIYYQWKQMISMIGDGCELNITKPVMQYIAKRCILNKTGTRELVSEYQTLLSEVYEKVELDNNIKSVSVNIKAGQPVITYETDIKALENTKLFTATLNH